VTAVSVIVVSHAGLDHLEDSLGSLADERVRAGAEVVLVDNGSADGCGEAAGRRWPWLDVVRSEVNLGFAGGVDLGADAATGDVLILINDDAAAEHGFVEAHVDALADHPEAAVSAGRLTSWDGAEHDFVRGVVTFDVHAFQLGQGWPLDGFATPEDGEPLPFACGGNMAIRRSDWNAVGGFDRDLFAYFEDVDLGWRLWAMERAVVAAPGAVARHRGAATSSRLGDFRRGVLFERNALRTFFACADADHRAALAPAVVTTFLHRLAAYAETDAALHGLSADPFGAVPPPPGRAERWRRRLRERGVLGAARHLLSRIVMGPEAGAPTVTDGHFLMQLRAASGFFSGLDDTQRRRRELEAVRRVPDRAILERFPRLVVPTYPGDDEWFASESFADLLPDDWPLEVRRLDQVLHPSIIRG
jgi:GT2 family glycosyltransferase